MSGCISSAIFFQTYFFIAYDGGSGVAGVRVRFFDAQGQKMETFAVCGFMGSPPCDYTVYLYAIAEQVLTYIPAHTARMRVEFTWKS